VAVPLPLPFAEFLLENGVLAAAAHHPASTLMSS
jgi:hypothetical protein